VSNANQNSFSGRSCDVSSAIPDFSALKDTGRKAAVVCFLPLPWFVLVLGRSPRESRAWKRKASHAAIVGLWFPFFSDLVD
jgi:hypothetical protein